MTILHLITRLIFGGAQHNTVLSCAAQVEAGHEVHLAFGPIFGPEGSLMDEARQSGATVHEVQPMVREVSPLQDRRCYKALVALIGEVDPDIVHTHSSKAGVLGRAAAWRAGGRSRGGTRPAVVHTVHGLGFHERQPALVRRAYIASERWAAKRCDRLIAITPQMVDAFVEHNIAPREKFTVVPSGIPLDRFKGDETHSRAAARESLGIPPDAVVVVLLGRLDPLKGQLDLIDIFPRLVERFPEVHLLFIGGGFARPQVEETIRSSGLTGRVTITGTVPHTDVAGLLSAADVSVLPSYQEGQSRTLAESLLCGVPVVGYAAGGIPSLIIDGETGRLVPVGDKPALAQAIVDVIETPEASAQMTARGAAHVRKHFDAADMAEPIQRVYDLAIKDAQQRTSN